MKTLTIFLTAVSLFAQTAAVSAKAPAGPKPAAPAAATPAYKALKFPPLRDVKIPAVEQFTLANGMRVRRRRSALPT
jgi:hypothetical protein